MPAAERRAHIDHRKRPISTTRPICRTRPTSTRSRPIRRTCRSRTAGRTGRRRGNPPPVRRTGRGRRSPATTCRSAAGDDGWVMLRCIGAAVDARWRRRRSRERARAAAARAEAAADARVGCTREDAERQRHGKHRHELTKRETDHLNLPAPAAYLPAVFSHLNIVSMPSVWKGPSVPHRTPCLPTCFPAAQAGRGRRHVRPVEPQAWLRLSIDVHRQHPAGADQQTPGLVGADLDLLALRDELSVAEKPARVAAAQLCVSAARRLVQWRTGICD